MNTMVRRPVRNARSASAITRLISLMPESTALKAMNSERVSRAINRASVVLPQPGGPHRIIEPISSRAICVRSGLPGPSSASWPTNSSIVRGRMRSASGRSASDSSSRGPGWANKLTIVGCVRARVLCRYVFVKVPRCLAAS
jgi:hypothetical protein